MGQKIHKLTFEKPSRNEREPVCGLFGIFAVKNLQKTRLFLADLHLTAIFTLLIQKL
jgi:hypothetical protein